MFHTWELHIGKNIHLWPYAVGLFIFPNINYVLLKQTRVGWRHIELESDYRILHSILFTVKQEGKRTSWYLSEATVREQWSEWSVRYCSWSGTCNMIHGECAQEKTHFWEIASTTTTVLCTWTCPSVPLRSGSPRCATSQDCIGFPFDQPAWAQSHFFITPWELQAAFCFC